MRLCIDPFKWKDTIDSKKDDMKFWSSVFALDDYMFHLKQSFLKNLETEEPYLTVVSYSNCSSSSHKDEFTHEIFYDNACL